MATRAAPFTDGSRRPARTRFSISNANPAAFAISGDNLYVANSGQRAVQEYGATTGALDGGFTLNGINPTAVAVGSVPEAASVLLLIGSGLPLLQYRRRRVVRA